MIRQGSIHVAASDAHRDRRRVPRITPAREPISAWTNETVSKLLVETYPTDLAAGRSPDLEPLRRALPPRRAPWWKKLVGA
jgi:hypothetical protein